MKIEQLKVTWQGKTYEGQVGVPESLKDAVENLGEGLVFQDFLRGYKDRVKKRVRGVKPRQKRWLKIDAKGLSSDQVHALKQAGILV